MYKKKKKKTQKTVSKKKLGERKTLEQMIMEDGLSKASDQPNYLTMRVKPSKYPPRQFCCICGFFSKYTCIRCGERSCCKKCFTVHKDVRCLKFAD